MSSRIRFLSGAALIAMLALAAYWPSLHGGFILDDDKLVTESSLIQASDGLHRIWFTTQPQDYWPLTNTSFWLEWRLWGKNATGYHVANLLLHIASSLLVWRILRMLSIPGAFLAALVFAIHPVNVQSVAWISQRKNTLSMLLFLVSILWYLKTEQGRWARDEGREIGGENTDGRWRLWYLLSLFAFVLAMLSKGSVAILPLVLLLIVWWQQRQITISDLVRTAPFFGVAIVLTTVNLWFQTHGADAVIRDVDLPQRLAGAGTAIWFYLSKALLPIELMFIYPQWNIRTAEFLWWLPLLAAVIITGALFQNRNRTLCRSLLFAWIFFCIALLPVLGFVDVGFMRFSFVADHYQYLALIGVTGLVAASWSVWHRRTKGVLRSAAVLFASGAVVALTLLTWEQSQLYADAVTLYRATLQKNPDCWVIHNNLGERLLDTGQTHDAQAHFEEALRLKSIYPDAHNNLGNALLKMGRLQDAIEQYRRALRQKPDYLEPYANLALAYAQLERRSDAIAAAEKAIQLAQSQTNTLLAQRIEKWLTSYRAGQTEPNNAHH